MPSSTDSGARIRCASAPASSALRRSESSLSGEPVADQMRRYFFATRRGRSGRTIPYSSGSHSARGSSTTRGSARKRGRKARTAAASAACGVPELTSRMPMRSVTSAETHAEVFQLSVVEDPVLRALAAGARLLDASEGRDLGGDDSGVEADDAVLERLRDAPRARQVARVEVGREPEFGVVRHIYGVLLGLEAEQRRHGSKGLLARHQHVARHVHDHGRLEEGAAERVALAALHDPSALAHGIAEALLPLGERLGVDERTMICRTFESVADPQLRHPCN